jgi:predicted lipoprotein with Yx(FWY)xxD motif
MTRSASAWHNLYSAHVGTAQGAMSCLDRQPGTMDWHEHDIIMWLT